MRLLRTGDLDIHRLDVLRRETEEHLRSYDEHLDRLLAEVLGVPKRLREILDARR